MQIEEILRDQKIVCSVGNDDNWKIQCPNPDHIDSNPSCFVHKSTGVWGCFSCNAKGNFVQLIELVTKKNHQEAIRLLNQYGYSTERTIKIQTVETYHKKLSVNQELLQQLFIRGVNPDLINYYRLGCDGDRVVIPIKNAAGHYVTTRKYLPGAAEHKVISQKYRGDNRWYPIEQLKYDSIVLTGGEMKAIVGAFYLNNYDIGCITGLHGEGNLTPQMAEDLKGKSIYVCHDIDKAGELASIKDAKFVSRFAEHVYIVSLPLDKIKFPKGDINDFVMVNLNNVQALRDAVLKGEKYTYQKETTELLDTEPISVNMLEATDPVNIGERIKLRARVVAFYDQPFQLPKDVEVICDKSESCCSDCPVFSKEPPIFTIQEESRQLLNMCRDTDLVRERECRKDIGIPKLCKKCSIETKSYYAIQEIRLTQSLELTNRDRTNVIHTAYNIGFEIEPNAEYEFIGRCHPSKDEQATQFIFSRYEPCESALSRYVPPNDLHNLQIFQPKEGQWTFEALDSKIRHIYSDLSANVTHIYERLRMHLAVDLVYHSVLNFRLQDEIVKGWTECLIVGDSSIGKTKVATGLQKHYGLGKYFPCKEATVGGILGGAMQMNQRWFCTWGVIPLYDKQLVILEEVSGAKEGAINALTNMRSSGIADISKIITRQTHARTRLVWVSNPKNGMNVRQYAHGVNAVIDLIKAPEDIRRFDMCLVEASSDIAETDISRLQAHRPQEDHIYTEQLCNELILWVWTRTEDQVQFTSEAIQKLEYWTNKLTVKYDDSEAPIVDRGTTRFKIARLAVALAARTFSHNDDFKTVLVRECHIDLLCIYLQSIYDETSISYGPWSRAKKELMGITAENATILWDQIRSIPNKIDFVKLLKNVTEFNRQDIQDWTGYDPIAANRVLSLLVCKNAVKRHKNVYIKTEEFQQLLFKMYDRLTKPEGESNERA